MSLPFCSALVNHVWSSTSSAGLARTRDMGMLKQVQQKFIKTMKGLQHMRYEVTVKLLGLFGLEKRRLRGALMHVYKYSMWKSKEGGTRLFSVVHSDSTLHDGHKEKNRKFLLNTHKKIIFTVRTVEHWNRLIRDIVESPSLETLKPNWTQP